MREWREKECMEGENEGVGFLKGGRERRRKCGRTGESRRK